MNARPMRGYNHHVVFRVMLDTPLERAHRGFG